ncbi:hypothetical protein M9Y10_042397 [Tritrichomonas musculus]|uniref:Uncharacterized protein n=1 Tax=Tritrichomonas musculus TaxID=1915356 RepID=A0ABR2GJR2_9EUKA
MVGLLTVDRHSVVVTDGHDDHSGQDLQMVDVAPEENGFRRALEADVQRHLHSTSDGLDELASILQIPRIDRNGLRGRGLLLVWDELLPVGETPLDFAQLDDCPVVFLVLLQVVHGLRWLALSRESGHGIRVDDQVIIGCFKLVCECAAVDGQRCLANVNLDGCDDSPGQVLACPGCDGPDGLGTDGCPHGSS